MNDDKNTGHDVIAMLLLKLVTGGHAGHAEVAAASPLAAPKEPHDDGVLFVPGARAKKGW